MCIVIINETPSKRVSLYSLNYKLLFCIQISCFYIPQFFFSHVHFQKSDVTKFSPWHKRDNPPGSEWVKSIGKLFHNRVRSTLWCVNHICDIKIKSTNSTTNSTSDLTYIIISMIICLDDLQILRKQPLFCRTKLVFTFTTPHRFLCRFSLL